MGQPFQRYWLLKLTPQKLDSIRKYSFLPLPWVQKRNCIHQKRSGFESMTSSKTHYPPTLPLVTNTPLSYLTRGESKHIIYDVINSRSDSCYFNQLNTGFPSTAYSPSSSKHVNQSLWAQLMMSVEEMNLRANKRVNPSPPHCITEANEVM